MNDDRILHLIHTPRHSGAEIVVRELCLIHQGQGLHTAIASFNPSEDGFLDSVRHLEKSGVGIFFPKARLSGLDRIRFFRSTYDGFMPNLIYGHSVLPALYGRLALIPNSQKRRFISVLHSATNDDYADLKLWVSELLVARQSDRIFAVSNKGAQSYQRRIPYHKPVEVVPNGSDLTRIREAALQRDRNREQLGLRPTQRLILQIGRLSPVKQQMLSLEALTPMLQSSGNVQLWFAGLTESAPYEAALSASIASANLQDRVKVLGSREDVPALLSAADVYIMPSLEEAHSVALIEALASGVAIVASNIDQFLYAESMPGVLLTAPSGKEKFAQCIESLLGADSRFNRDLKNLDIRDVANIYSSFLKR